MPKTITKAELLVEGRDDQHVVWALCQQHQVPQTFTVVTPSKNTGVEALLKSLPVRLKMASLETLGIMLDADQNLTSRWEAICDRLKQVGYLDLPAHPDPNGSIISGEQMPRFGIWLMPDNQLPGTLENFVTHLILDEDVLATKAEGILEEIEREGLNKYILGYHQKAFIHTWLAWQERPGQPMGQAITAQVLKHNRPLAQKFVQWLNLLFNAS